MQASACESFLFLPHRKIVCTPFVPHFNQRVDPLSDYFQRNRPQSSIAVCTALLRTASASNLSVKRRPDADSFGKQKLAIRHLKFPCPRSSFQIFRLAPHAIMPRPIAIMRNRFAQTNLRITSAGISPLGVRQHPARPGRCR